MKITIILIMFIIGYSCIWSQEFQIDKIGEIAYAQEFGGSESVQVIENYLYFGSTNGLEIYEINGDGSITKLSILTIPGTMLIKDQYCFIKSGGYNIPGYHLRIYKINISDVYNPVIVDQIEYPELNQGTKLFKLGNYMVLRWFGVEGFYHDFYSLPEMEYIGQIITETHYKPLYDSLLVRQDGYILYIERYNPPDEFEIIGTTDVSAYSDGNYAYDHYKVINDTILSAVNLRNITFWNISDVTNWQYISRYTLPEDTGMLGNKQYTIMYENAVIFSPSLIRLLDISDIMNPVLADSTDGIRAFWGQACDFYENNLYVSSSNFGIQHYRIENNTIEHSGSYYDHKSFFLGDMYEGKIIAGNISTGLSSDGYSLFDVEDPLNPVDLGEWFPEKKYRLIHKQGGWMVLKDYEEYRFELYDITSLENPVLRNTLSLGNLYDFVWTFCFIDESDPISIYLCNYETNLFWKFNISEPGEAVELFEYELPSTPGGLTIINSVAYVTVGTSPFDLLVIDGLEDNEPYIANEINNFSENQWLNGQDGYLVVNAITYDIGQVFQLDDPLQPELYFTPQWGERIEIRDDLIFTRMKHIVGVYENNPNVTEPIAIFNGLNYIYNIELMEHEGTNYLITIEMANIGLFEYNYESGSVDNELAVCKPYLANFPNPFNPETTINYYLKENSKVSLKIYNIKGQLVKTLLDDIKPAGDHSVIWDGSDSNGNRVGSAIYFYKLKTDNFKKTKKMILLK